jgi:hypothetical protein
MGVFLLWFQLAGGFAAVPRKAMRAFHLLERRDMRRSLRPKKALRPYWDDESP